MLRSKLLYTVPRIVFRPGVQISFNCLAKMRPLGYKIPLSNIDSIMAFSSSVTRFEKKGLKNERHIEKTIDSQGGIEEKSTESGTEDGAGGRDKSGWWRRNWDWYRQRFWDRPASHLTSFLILHEITAILPIFGVYYVLKATELKFPIPEKVLADGNRLISKLRSMAGYEPLDKDDQTMMHLVASYTVVKAALPLRLAASFALTPCFSRTVVEPIANLLKKVLTKLSRK